MFASECRTRRSRAFGTGTAATASRLHSFEGISDAPWGGISVRVDARNGPVDNLRIELARGVPLAVRPSGDSFRDIRLRILDSAGELLVSGGLWSHAPQPIPLAPGAYTVEGRVGEGEPTRIPVTIATEPVELALP